jgi:pyruvate dehydrogenase E1 component alpha subunit
VWVVNNNQYAYSTPNELEFKTPTIAERSSAYGIPGVRVDGANVLEVYEAATKAVAKARTGGGPTLIESVSLRWRGHAGHDAAKYVPKELLDDHQENKDPVARFRRLLLDKGAITQPEIDELQARIEARFAEGYEFAQGSPFPEAGEVTRGLYTDDGYWTSEPGRGGGTDA